MLKRYYFRYIGLNVSLKLKIHLFSFLHFKKYGYQKILNPLCSSNFILLGSDNLEISSKAGLALSLGSAPLKSLNFSKSQNLSCIIIVLTILF